MSYLFTCASSTILNKCTRIETEDAIYSLAKKHHPSHLALVASHGPGLLGRAIQYGIGDAHATDVKAIKQRIIDIYELVSMPSKKSGWGAHHLQTARLLRPEGVNEGSTEW